MVKNVKEEKVYLEGIENHCGILSRAFLCFHLCFRTLILAVRRMDHREL